MKSITIIFILIFCLTFKSKSQQYEYIALAQPTGNSLWGYINEKGDFVIPPSFKYAYSFNECGLAPIYDSYADEIIYINIKGDTILRSTEDYDLIKPEGPNLFIPIFSEGYLQVKKGDKYGFINTIGEVIIPAKYDTVSTINNGVAVTKNDTYFVIIDTLGNETQINIPNLKSVERFNNGMALFTTIEEKVGFIDNSGEVKVDAQFINAGFFTNELACVKDTTGFWGVIDKSGKWIIVPKFKTMMSFDEKSNWTTATDRSNRAVILTKDGTIKSLEKYNWVNDVSEGLARATAKITLKDKRIDRKEKRKNLAGLINIDGEWAIYPSYDNVKHFKNGYCIARVGRVFGFIDKYGVWVVKPQFTNLGDMVKITKKAIPNEPYDTSSTEFDYYDIIKYLNIIESLSASDDSNSSGYTWKDFFSQEYKFINWLLDFKYDTNNIGLWEKAKNIFIIESRSLSNIDKNDSETALILLEIFLDGEYDSFNTNKKYTYNQIESFVKKNQNKDIPYIRSEWRKRNNN